MVFKEEFVVEVKVEKLEKVKFLVFKSFVEEAKLKVEVGVGKGE